MTEIEIAKLAKLIAAELRKAPLPVETRTEKRERIREHDARLARQMNGQALADTARHNADELTRSVHAEP